MSGNLLCFGFCAGVSNKNCLLTILLSITDIHVLIAEIALTVHLISPEEIICIKC